MFSRGTIEVTLDQYLSSLCFRKGKIREGTAGQRNQINKETKFLWEKINEVYCLDHFCCSSSYSIGGMFSFSDYDIKIYIHSASVFLIFFPAWVAVFVGF